MVSGSSKKFLKAISSGPRSLCSWRWASKGRRNTFPNCSVSKPTRARTTKPSTANSRRACAKSSPAATAAAASRSSSGRSTRGAARRGPSINIRHDMHRRGIGRALLEELIARARAIGFHSLIGGASADQTASVALQESLGFQHIGRFKQVGYKFGQWLDVAVLQLMLKEAP